MDQENRNWYKLLSGATSLIYVVSLVLVRFSCADVNFDNIAQTLWLTIACGIYGLLALVAFGLSTFVALIGLYADHGSTGRQAIFFQLVLFINLTGAVGVVYLSVR